MSAPPFSQTSWDPAYQNSAQWPPANATYRPNSGCPLYNPSPQPLPIGVMDDQNHRMYAKENTPSVLFGHNSVLPTSSRAPGPIFYAMGLMRHMGLNRLMLFGLMPVPVGSENFTPMGFCPYPGFVTNAIPSLMTSGPIHEGDQAVPRFGTNTTNTMASVPGMHHPGKRNSH